MSQNTLRTALHFTWHGASKHVVLVQGLSCHSLWQVHLEHSAGSHSSSLGFAEMTTQRVFQTLTENNQTFSIQVKRLW